MFRQWLYDTLNLAHPGHLFEVMVPPDAKMGDYSVNLAFVLAKAEKKNPHEVAQALCDELMATGNEMIERCEIAGPGFVNIFLKDEYLRGQLGKNEISATGKDKKVIVEYSSPNIAKPMHVGHLRSTVIGDALVNVYVELGYDVVRWNYIGDWGTQFGKLIAGHKNWPVMPIDSIKDLAALYVRANAELDEGAGRAEFKKLEDGNEENRLIWEKFRTRSLWEFEQMYQRLNIHKFDIKKGESDYESELKPLIEKLIKLGTAKESEGAIIIDLTNESLPPALLRKSDGATLYLTRDLASLEDRIKEYHPAKILYVVANQQALHFEQLFAVKDKLKLGDTETVHVKFGMVLGEDGKKLATREGKVIPLQEVIDKITTLAGEIVRKKNSELSEEQTNEVARVVGIGALKYNDLRQHPYSDIVFDWDAMLDLSGNSGPYLQYTYARLANILRKSESQPASDNLRLLTNATERAMMRQMLDFGYAIEQCAQHYALNGLALHLYELANLANRYYETVRINDDEDNDRKSARLQLVTAVMAQIKKGLGLLGIQVLERI